MDARKGFLLKWTPRRKTISSRRHTDVDRTGWPRHIGALCAAFTDASWHLYPPMRGGQVDAGFHTIAANSPVAWYVSDDDARVGGYTIDVRAASKQQWTDVPELSSRREQQDSIAGAKHLRFSRFYPSLPIID